MGDTRRPTMTWTLVAHLFLGLIACGGDTDPGESVPEMTVEELMQPENCEQCHAEQYREWASSMHAYSTKDPVFRAMNARGQELTNGELGVFCVQCHAPLAVATGDVVDGTNEELDALDPEFASVNCYFCHNVNAIETDHDGLMKTENNPLLLAWDTTMRGGLKDPVRPPVHNVAYSELMDGDMLESANMCGPCHDIVTDPPASVHLERTFAEWKENIVAQPTTSKDDQATCNSCHMDLHDGIAADTDTVDVPFRGGDEGLHSHLFAGLDIALTDDHPDVDVQLQAVECLQVNAATVNYIQLRMEANLLSLQVETETSAGHGFPTGATQDRRVWLDVTMITASGEVVAISRVADDEAVSEVAEANNRVLTFHDHMTDAQGEETHNFWEAAEVSQRGLPSARVGEHTRTSRISLAPAATPEHPPQRVEVVIKMRAVGRDVIEDLLDSGHLGSEYAGISDRIPTIEVAGSRKVWDASQHELGEQVRILPPSEVDPSKIPVCRGY